MRPTTSINRIRRDYPNIMEGFHGSDGMDYAFFEPDEDIDQDQYDREL